MKDLEDRPKFKNIIHLWEFLLELLNNDRYSSIIEWTRKDQREFKLVNQEEVARQWGLLKQRKGMTYDKLSRSLRYYYDKKIISKVSGQKLVYKFRDLPFDYLPLRNMDQTTRRKQLLGQINRSSCLPKPIATPPEMSTPQASPALRPFQPSHPSAFEPPRPSVIRSISHNSVIYTGPSLTKPFCEATPRIMSKSQIIFPACNCIMAVSPFVQP